MSTSAKRYFGHQHIRLLIGTFGRVFSNFYYARFSSDGKKLNELVRVPIMYLPSSHSHIQPNRDKENLSDLELQMSTFVSTFPRLSFEFKGLTYDSSRQLTNSQVYNNKAQYGFSPAPYDLQFEVRLAARDQLRALEILEQILPWFRPSLNVSIKHEVFEDQERGVIIELDSVDFEDNYDNTPAQRMVEYVLQFTMQTALWGPASGADLEILKFIEDGGTVIEDAVSGTTYSDGDGLDITIPETSGCIKTIIVNWLDYNSKDFNDAKYYPILEEIITSD